MTNFKHHVQFFTVAINSWHNVLNSDETKLIVIESMRFLVKEKRIQVFGFVIMPNHIHIIWRINSGYLRSDLQRDFLKFTAQQIKFHLQKYQPDLLEILKVDSKDRIYQIWQKNALSVDLWSKRFIEQKLNYIHNNPLQHKWQLADLPGNYPYSSASYYIKNEKNFDFLTHYLDG